MAIQFGRRITVLSVLVMVLLGTRGSLAGDAAEEDFRDFNELNLETLLSQTVVSASKHEQLISESPAAVTVITAEQIAASGAASIPEILRDVPGLDVILASSADFSVSARGLNKAGANSTLVMVDGRSVYEDFYGPTLWKSVPVALEEIQTIEVIKGPGSAFYGANAFAAVINIITFPPGEIVGTRVSARATSRGAGLGSVVHAGQSRNYGWRVSGNTERSLNWETDRTDLNMTRLNGRLDRRLSERSTASVSGGYTNGLQNFDPSGASLSLDGQTYYARTDFDWGNWQVRWFWNRSILNVVSLKQANLSDLSYLDTQAQDLEFQHSLRPFAGHLLQWGGSYRAKRFRWTREADPVKQDLYSAFAYDEWRIRQGLLLSLGLRWDYHPLVENHLAPRGGIVWRPNDHQALRASYGVAYRNPSYLENYLYYEYFGPFNTVSVVRGDKNLASERMRSLEVGYQGLVADDILGSVAVFHNRVDNLVDMVMTEEIPVPPAPFPGIPLELAFVNDKDWTITGGELAVEKVPARWLKARAHYSYLWGEDTRTGEKVGSVPNHMAGAALTFFPESPQSLFLVGRFKSSTTWPVTTAGTTGTDQTAASRVTFDLRWQYRRVADSARAVVGVENVFDRNFRDVPTGIERGRQVFVSVGVGF